MIERARAAVFPTLVAILLMAAGCAGAPPRREPSRDAQGRLGEMAPEGTSDQADQLFVLNSQGVDVTNRYLSTVIVTTDDPRGMCSGVLISDRLVLTAGHCVCVKQAITSSSGVIGAAIDGSRCVGKAYVTFTDYRPAKARLQYLMEPRTYEGVVRPHGELKIRLDAGDNVVSSKADLALIRLEEPVKGVDVVPLASSEVRNAESLVMVGYGANKTDPEEAMPGFRRYGTNQVTEVLPPEEGLFVMGREGAHSYAGDSGGPCFREDKKGRWLVGISARGTGRISRFTSTYRYKAWLEKEIKLAAKQKT